MCATNITKKIKQKTILYCIQKLVHKMKSLKNYTRIQNGIRVLSGNSMNQCLYYVCAIKETKGRSTFTLFGIYCIYNDIRHRKKELAGLVFNAPTPPRLTLTKNMRARKGVRS